MLQDIVGAQKKQAQPQRLMVTQAAAQPADACQQLVVLASACWDTSLGACAPCTPVHVTQGLTALSGGG